MKVLVACEFSGIVRSAFRRRGHEALSCDLMDCEDDSPYHYIGDCLEILNEGWDLIIAHPPCTYLASSGLHWNNKVPGRAEKTEEALKFVSAILNADCPSIALENPVGCISTRIRKFDQMIQPYEFGDNASKKTCLWLKNLPKLTPTKYISPSCPYLSCFGECDHKKVWANQTPSGQNKLGPSENRAKERSRTYAGIANAMAEQWG
jgi:hypothetical protein